LRQLLGRRLGIDPAAVALEVSEHGKPTFGAAHRPSDLAFNVSHSGSLAVYAFARRRAVGVDIEELRDIPDAEGLAARFFAPTEIAAFRAVSPDRRNLAFLACWTRKEAFVKAIGAGLSHPLDAFDVTVDPEGPARITRIGARSSGDLGWSMASFRPRDGYIGALVYSDDR
jgi:4'-phosphopantetheinyl transferase